MIKKNYLQQFPKGKEQSAEKLEYDETKIKMPKINLAEWNQKFEVIYLLGLEHKSTYT